MGVSPVSREQTIADLVDRWCHGNMASSFLVDLATLPRAPRHVPRSPALSPSVHKALDSIGILEPWSHQGEVWEALGAGRDVVVSTPTASGKSLSWIVPVLDRISRDPAASALVLFPTKALARDQEAVIRDLVAAAELEAPVYVYDGDTPEGERRHARQQAQVLLTNPDMLHGGILPHHVSWSAFFAGLSFIVVDELHGYRGVFGSHVANVLRRLDRVTSFHGGHPVWVGLSATISNPAELGRTLFGRPVELVDESGAPSGLKRFLIYDPPVIDEERGLRRAAVSEGARIARDLVLGGLTTLVFCQTRRQVEVVLRYLRDQLARHGGDVTRIRGYRGGYLPSLRREIEAELKAGRLDAVVTTNALELGIDVGGVDAVLLVGYPGTIASTRQRAGRAGRRGAASLAVMVTGGRPLDQFLARNPGWLFDASPEQALCEPDNVEILLAHLVCAAFELPFGSGERFGDLPMADLHEALDCLAHEGRLQAGRGRWHFVGSEYPAATVGIRSVGGRRVVVEHAESGAALAEVDPRAARLELHQGAIYQLEGETWQVLELDLERGRARVAPHNAPYYTVAEAGVTVQVLAEHETAERGSIRVAQGEVEVTERVRGFKKVRFHTHENLGFEPLDLPPLVMETEATWLVALPPPAATGPVAWAELLEAAGTALHEVAALHLMCAPEDLAHTVRVLAADEGADRPAVLALFFYDTHAGGVGLARRLFNLVGTVVADAARLVGGCRCQRGCPACIGPVADPRSRLKDDCAAWLDGLSSGDDR